MSPEASSTPKTEQTQTMHYVFLLVLMSQDKVHPKNPLQGIPSIVIKQTEHQ